MPHTKAPDWLEAPWRCFHQLSGARPHTLVGFAAPMGGMLLKSVPGGIPWLAIADWCDRHGYGPDEAEFVTAAVSAMDVAFLNWWKLRNAN